MADSRCWRSAIRVVAAVVALAVAGCTNESSEPVEPTPPAAPCHALEIELSDGSCVRPGVGPDACAQGFEHDGEYGCDPILPAERCPEGLMAVPGDTACRPVMECGPGKWGDIPVDANTVHVDMAYTGGNSDGSASSPFTTIGAAVSAAADGALIAIAEGRYLEDVALTNKSVRLWGVCPQKVAIVGVGGQLGAINVYYSRGTEIRGLAVEGAMGGINISGAEDVTIDRLWVHGTDARGISAEDAYGPTSTYTTGTLIERAHTVGLFVMGTRAQIEGTVVRSTLARTSDRVGGRGIMVQLRCLPGGCDETAPASATIVGSVVEDNLDYGVFVMASDAVIDSTVIRGTMPRASDTTFGLGVSVQSCGPTHGCDQVTRATATVRSSLVEQNHEVGIAIFGSDGTVEDTVVRWTLPRPGEETRGVGVHFQEPCFNDICDPAYPATGAVRNVLVEHSHLGALVVAESDVTVDNSVLRSTVGEPGTGFFGDGVVVIGDLGPATAALRGVRIADSARAGLSNFAATVALNDTRIGCAAFALVGEPFGEKQASFEDGGNNLCGCPNADQDCKAVSEGLQAPSPYSN